MEWMDWLLFLCFIACTFSLYFSFNRKHYDPDKVLVDMGDEVFISHLPKAKIHRDFGKTISKSFVAKVQLAGNYVTLFNSSGNAIDIWTPKDQLAEAVFERANAIFKNAEIVVIDC